MTSETPDITAGINGLQSAFSAADTLLSTMDGHDRDDSSYWKAVATIPLAALLYTVSPAGGGGGLAEARRIAAETDDTTRWSQVAASCAESLLADAVRRMLELQPRQRESVQRVIRDALTNPDDPEA